jgi:hypothetical protein
MPCPYAHALGVPGQGFHSARFMGIAVNDTLATIVLAFLTTYIVNISFLKSLLGWFILGEILHYWFGTNTAFLKMIHLSPNCS